MLGQHDFLFKNPDFLLKKDEFITKTGCAEMLGVLKLVLSLSVDR